MNTGKCKHPSLLPGHRVGCPLTEAPLSTAKQEQTGSDGIPTSALNRLWEELVSQPRSANSSVTLTDWSASLDISTFQMTKLTSTVFYFLFGPPCLKSREHSLAFAMFSFILEIFHESFHFHQFHMESYIQFFVTYSCLSRELFISNKPGQK